MDTPQPRNLNPQPNLPSKPPRYLPREVPNLEEADECGVSFLYDSSSSSAAFTFNDESTVHVTASHEETYALLKAIREHVTSEREDAETAFRERMLSAVGSLRS